MTEKEGEQIDIECLRNVSDNKTIANMAIMNIKRD